MAEKTTDRASRIVLWTAVGLALLTCVRVALIDGLFRRVTIDGPSMAPAFLGSHFHSRCGDCSFPIVFDAEHLPRDEQIACPNCGQLASHAAAVAMLRERVLIDRWPLVWRSPRRFEVVAFRTSEGELNVKRVVWLAGERPVVAGGELFDGRTLIRKTERELRPMRLLVHDDQYRPQADQANLPRWRGSETGTGWKQERSGYVFAPISQAPATFDWLTYGHWPGTFDQARRTTPGPITDNDPYNQGEVSRELNEVGDVLLSCRLRAWGLFVLTATDGERRFEVEIEPGRRVTLRRGDERLLVRAMGQHALRWWSDLTFGLCDGQVLLVINGQTILSYAYSESEPVAGAVLHPLAIGGGQHRMGVEQLRVWRDIYYLDARGLGGRWESARPLGAAEAGLLGDNQVVSIDSRHWEQPEVAATSFLGVVYRPFWAGPAGVTSKLFNAETAESGTTTARHVRNQRK